MSKPITTQVMAATLKTDSVRGMAAIVGTPDPISLKQLFKDFKKMAKPRTPTDIEDTGPDLMFITWVDPGANHFWRATSWNAKLLRGSTPIPPELDHTPTPVLATNEDQKPGITYTCYVQAFNDFGRSAISADTFWDPDWPDVHWSGGDGDPGNGDGGEDGGDDE